MRSLIDIYKFFPHTHVKNYFILQVPHFNHVLFSFVNKFSIAVLNFA